MELILVIKIFDTMKDSRVHCQKDSGTGFTDNPTTIKK
jgi:hypothetical protein